MNFNTMTCDQLDAWINDPANANSPDMAAAEHAYLTKGCASGAGGQSGGGGHDLPPPPGG